jgi:hypothetical protein
MKGAVLLVLIAACISVSLASVCSNPNSLKCQDAMEMFTYCCGRAKNSPVNITTTIQTTITECEAAITPMCNSSYEEFIAVINPFIENPVFDFTTIEPDTENSTVLYACVAKLLQNYYQPRRRALGQLVPAYAAHEAQLSTKESYCKFDGITCAPDMSPPRNRKLFNNKKWYPCHVQSAYGELLMDMRVTGSDAFDYCNMYKYPYLRHDEVISLTVAIARNNTASPVYIDFTPVLTFPVLHQIVLELSDADVYPHDLNVTHPINATYGPMEFYIDFLQDFTLYRSKISRFTVGKNFALQNYEVLEYVQSKIGFIWLDMVNNFWSGAYDYSLLTNYFASLKVLTIFNQDQLTWSHIGPVVSESNVGLLLYLPPTLEHYFFTDEFRSNPYANPASFDISGAANLKTFYMSNTSLAGVTSAQFCASGSKLTRITLSNSLDPFSVNVANSFVHCPPFSVLDLSNNDVRWVGARRPIQFAFGAYIDLSGNANMHISVTNDMTFNGSPTYMNFDGMLNLVGQFTPDLCRKDIELRLANVPMNTDKTLGVCRQGLIYTEYNEGCANIPMCL